MAVTAELDGVMKNRHEGASEVRPLAEVLTYLLVGQTYLFGRETYGGEFTLHFGREVGYGHPKLDGKTRGSHVLSVRASGWLLRSGTRPAIVGCQIIPDGAGEGKPISKAVFESGAFVKPGSRVIRVDPFAAIRLNGSQAFGLALTLSDMTDVLIVPMPVAEDELADFELLCPSGLLRVGPADTWEFVRKD